MNKKQDAALDAAADLFLYNMLYAGTEYEERIVEKEKELESKLQEADPEFAGDIKRAMKGLDRMLGGEPVAPIWAG